MLSHPSAGLVGSRCAGLVPRRLQQLIFAVVVVECNHGALVLAVERGKVSAVELDMVLVVVLAVVDIGQHLERLVL